MQLDTLVDMTVARQLYQSMGFVEIPAYQKNRSSSVAESPNFGHKKLIFVAIC